MCEDQKAPAHELSRNAARQEPRRLGSLFSSFVIPFAIRKISTGAYGTEFSASLPQALGFWGYVDRIKLTLNHKYTYRGKQLSYFNFGYPALKAAKRAVLPWPLFEFAEGLSLSA